jgi:hypothetical protein
MTRRHPERVLSPHRNVPVGFIARRHHPEGTQTRVRHSVVHGFEKSTRDKSILTSECCQERKSFRMNMDFATLRIVVWPYSILAGRKTRWTVR